MFAATARPAWRLSLRTPGERGVPYGTSKIGGCPDMTPSEAWPRNARGVPLVFIAQLRPDEFPTLPEADQRWDHRGALIRLFADLLEEPNEPDHAIGLSTTSTDLAPAAMPDDPAVGGLSGGGEPGVVRALPERAVVAEPVLTLPAVHPALRDKPNHWMDPLSDRYEQFARVVDEERAVRSCQALGWPEDGHEDPLAAGPCVEDGYNTQDWSTQPSDWRLMLLVHYSPTHDGDPYASDDFYALVIRAADLAAARYDRLVCDVVFG
jgi:hypothetical protein